ncbi:hypothetical protein GGF31_008032 [Allomyces arbusculus]|nr:hypothetical protein GGF31_008032 [Allomyces arbusculus]
MHRGPALTPAEHALANRPESPFAVRWPASNASSSTAPTTPAPLPSSTATSTTPTSGSGLPQRSRLFSPPPLHSPRFDFLAATARLGGALNPNMDLVAASRPRAGSAPSVAAALANPFMPAAPRTRAWPAPAAPATATVIDDPPTPPHPPANPNLAAPRGILRRAVPAETVVPPSRANAALGTSAPTTASLRKVASTPHLPRADPSGGALDLNDIDDDYGVSASTSARARSQSRSRAPPPPAAAPSTPTVSGTSSARRRIRRDIDALLARHHRSNPDLRGAALAEQALANGDDGDDYEPHRAVPEPPAPMAHPVPLTLTRNQNRDTPSPPPPPPVVFARVPSRAEMARADIARAPSRGALGDGAGVARELAGLPRAPSRTDLRTPVAMAPIPRAPSRGDVRTPVTAAPLARAPSRAELVAAATAAAAVARVPSRAELRTPIDPAVAAAGIARVPSLANGALSTMPSVVLPQRNASEAVQRYLASMASATDGVEDEGTADMDQLRAENRSLRLKLLHYEAAALSSSETSLVQQKADLAAQVLQLQQRVRDLERDKLALQSQLAAVTAAKDPLHTPTAPTFFDRPITPATTVRRGSESSTASSLRAPSPTPRTRAPTVDDAATRMRLARPSLRDLRSTAAGPAVPATPASVATSTSTTATPRPGWLFGSAPRAPVRATAPLTPARTTPTAPRLIGAALGDNSTPTSARIPPTTPARHAPPMTPSALGLLRPALATPPRTVESGAAALRRLLGVPDDADLDDDSISDESVLERHWRGRASIEPLALTAPPTDLAAVPDSPESRTVSTLSSPRSVPGSGGRGGTRDRLRVRAAATAAAAAARASVAGTSEDSSVVFSEWDDADVTYLSNVALDLVSDRVVKVPRHAPGAAAVVPETARVEEDADVEDGIVDRTPARASMVLPEITSPSLFRPLFADLGGAVPVVAEEDESEVVAKAGAPHRESGWSDVVITGFDEDASVCSRDDDARRRHEQDEEDEEDHARPLHRLAQVNGSQIWTGAGAAETAASPSA